MKGGMNMVELNSQGDDKNQREMFFTGLSTDTKPIIWKGITPPQFSLFFELDTWAVYVFDYENKQWRTKPST